MEVSSHIIRYRVRPESAAENEKLLVAVFAELDQVRPAGLVFAVFKLDDGVTFVHMILLEQGHDRRQRRELGALKAFHARLSERCAEPPVRTAATAVGAFGLATPRLPG